MFVKNSAELITYVTISGFLKRWRSAGHCKWSSQILLSWLTPYSMTPWLSGTQYHSWY